MCRRFNCSSPSPGGGHGSDGGCCRAIHAVGCCWPPSICSSSSATRGIAAFDSKGPTPAESIIIFVVIIGAGGKIKK